MKDTGRPLPSNSLPSSEEAIWSYGVRWAEGNNSRVESGEDRGSED